MLVVVVDGDGEGSLGPLLADNVAIQFRPDLAWLGQGFERGPLPAAPSPVSRWRIFVQRVMQLSQM